MYLRVLRLIYSSIPAVFETAARVVALFDQLRTRPVTADFYALFNSEMYTAVNV